MNENELREIEARIAVELFGFKWVAFEWQTTADGLLKRRALLAPTLANEELAKEGHWMADGSEKPYEYIAYPVPRYARDIAAAMKAAEKMRERGWAYSLHSPLQKDTAFTFFMKPSEERADLSRVARMALTDAEAIARCIVAALDAEAKQNP